MNPLQFTLRDASNNEYVTCFLDDDIAVPPDQRELYLEYWHGLRPAECRVFMHSSAFAAMPSGVKSGTDKLSIHFTTNSVSWDSPSTVAVREFGTAVMFRIIQYRIFREGIDSAIYEVILKSDQWQLDFQSPSGEAYNILSQDKTKYAFGAVSSSAPNTYETLLTRIAGQCGTGLPNFDSSAISGLCPATYNPHNVYSNDEPPHRVLFRMLKPAGLTMGFFPFQDTGTTKIVAFAGTDPADYAKLKSMGDFSGADGCLTRMEDIAPAAIPYRVCYLYPYSTFSYSGASAMADSRYLQVSADNPVYTEGGCVETLVVGDHYAFASGTPTYTQDLDAITAERATRFFNRTNIPYRVRILQGAVDVPVDGHIRNVRITADIHGQFTRIVSHGLPDELGPSDLKSESFLMFSHSLGIVRRDDDTIECIGTGGGESSLGEYKGMVHMMVADTEDGWDWPKFIPRVVS